jgi:hypothetical protein
MDLLRLAGIVLKSAALWAGLAIIVLCLVLAAFGFLAAALFIWVAAHLGGAAAAALTALSLLLLAGLVMIFGGIMLARLRRRAPELFTDSSSTIATITSLIALLVRQDPKRTLLLALLSGALTEYFTAPRKPRG